MADAVLSLAKNPPQDALERKRLYDAARELMFKTEDKHDTTHRIYFSGFQLYLADIANDLAVFVTLVKAPERLWTANELASHLGCDLVLLTRILRGLAAYGMITVNADGNYGSAPATHTLADPGVAGCVRHNVITVFPSANALPEFLRQSGHKNPIDARAGAAQLAFNTDLDIFTWLGSHPENLKWVMINMAASRVGQESWIDSPNLFPAEYFQLSEDDIASSRALLVDVGAGSGHQSIALRQAHAHLQGRVVIQDLPHTITLTDKELLAQLKIEPMEHDFNTPQPIKGAKIYYMRNILHDWPDEVCHNILRQLRSAASPDSALIIDDIVIKEPEAQWQQVNYDLIMMSSLSAMERTFRQWDLMLKTAGFKLKEIREYDSGNGDSLIIAVPV